MDTQGSHTVIHAASTHVAMHIKRRGSTVITENTAVNIYNIITKTNKCSSLCPRTAIFYYCIPDIYRIARVRIKCSAC